jgi:hypothetical protein
MSRFILPNVSVVSPALLISVSMVDFFHLFYLISVFNFFGVWTQGFMLIKEAFYHLSHTSSPFCSGYFGDGISRTICLGWPWISILLILASQIARITGVSYRYLATVISSLYSTTERILKISLYFYVLKELEKSVLEISPIELQGPGAFWGSTALLRIALFIFSPSFSVI